MLFRNNLIKKVEISSMFYNAGQPRLVHQTMTSNEKLEIYFISTISETKLCLLITTTGWFIFISIPLVGQAFSKLFYSFDRLVYLLIIFEEST